MEGEGGERTYPNDNFCCFSSSAVAACSDFAFGAAIETSSCHLVAYLEGGGVSDDEEINLGLLGRVSEWGEGSGWEERGGEELG